jgi:hypothetical protein
LCVVELPMLNNSCWTNDFNSGSTCLECEETPH